MGRQVGAALGIGILVAVLGTAAPTAAGFHDAWIVPLVSAAIAGLLLACLGPHRVRAVAPLAAPAPAG